MDRFQDVIRLEPRRLFGFDQIDEGELVVGDGGFKFTGRTGQLLGHYVREVSTIESASLSKRVYEIKYGDDPSTPSKALFTYSRTTDRGPGDPLLIAFNQLMPVAALTLAQYERMSFPSQCVCCLEPATELRRCLDPAGKESYSFSLSDTSYTLNYAVPALNVPYCDSHIAGFDACTEIENSRSWKTATERGYWRRWDEAELADPRLRESRPYVNTHLAPHFGPSSDWPGKGLHLLFMYGWVGLRLDCIRSEERLDQLAPRERLDALAYFTTGSHVGEDLRDIVSKVVSIILRFQNPAYAPLFLSLNPAS